MEHGKVSVLPDFPTDEDSAEPIHPAVRAFYDPASRANARFAFQIFLLFAATSQMERETRCGSNGTSLIVVVSLVEAESLRRRTGRSRPRHRDALYRLGHELVVIAIRAINREADGNARAIGEEAALGSVLAAIRWVGSGPFPPRAEPWSWRRPVKASSTLCLWRRRKPRDLGARIRGRPRHRAIREICGRPTSTNRFLSHPRHSTDSQSAARRRSRPSHCDREPEGGGIQADVRAEAAIVAPSWPKVHRSASNLRHARSFPWTTTRWPIHRARNFLTIHRAAVPSRSYPTEIGSKL